ncbi:MAG: hypothetical protein C5B43_03620, partial [Verrucomicrobia bacterium]
MRIKNILKLSLVLLSLGGVGIFTPIYALEEDNGLVQQIDRLSDEIESIETAEIALYNQGIEYVDANPELTSTCLEDLDKNFSGLLFQFKPDIVSWDDFDPIKNFKIAQNDTTSMQQLLQKMEDTKKDLNAILAQVQVIVQNYKQGIDPCAVPDYSYTPITTEYNYVISDYTYPEYNYEYLTYYPDYDYGYGYDYGYPWVWGVGGLGLGWWAGWNWWNHWGSRDHHRRDREHHRDRHRRRDGDRKRRDGDRRRDGKRDGSRRDGRRRDGERRRDGGRRDGQERKAGGRHDGGRRDGGRRTGGDVNRRGTGGRHGGGDMGRRSGGHRTGGGQRRSG